ncbi:hypothetical protein MC885_020408, partial [Smutsia gigantea]
IKCAIIGMALGIAISAGFLALKICTIKKHLFDNESSDLRNTNSGFGVAHQSCCLLLDALLSLFRYPPAKEESPKVRSLPWG